MVNQFPSSPAALVSGNQNSTSALTHTNAPAGARVVRRHQAHVYNLIGRWLVSPAVPTIPTSRPPL